MWKFLRDKEGNIAMTFGIALLPIIMSVGAAVDYSNGARVQAKMANAADSALLSAASNVIENVDLSNKAAVEKVLKAKFRPFFLANMKENKRNDLKSTKIAYDPANQVVTAKVEYDYKSFVMGMMGKPLLNIEVIASTKIQMKAGGAISMFLVLDKSGSMGWAGRMNSLKLAVSSMTNQFETADPTHQYVRMGAVAYDSRTQRRERISWGSTRTNRYVQRLWAYGGTNSSNAVRVADRELNNRREEQEHNRRSGQSPSKIMVFMTDGSNNRSSWDRSTIRNCNTAKGHGIEIYTVAFQAPSRGRALLQSCASDNAHYYQASNSAELIRAFNKIGASVGEKLILTQ